MQLVVLSRFRRLVALLRLKPFETSTAEGLSRERHRRVALATVASGLAKGVSVLATLVIIPLTLHYLGDERYALWVMLSSMFASLALLDFGICTGLLGFIATAHGKDDKKAIKEYVSSAFFIVLFIGWSIGLVVLIGCAFIPMGKVFNVTSPLAIHEVTWAVVVLALLQGLFMPLGVVLRFQEGLQEGFSTYLAQMTGSILSLLGALLAVHLRLGLPWLVLGLLGGACLGNLGSFVLQFFVFKKWAQPAWRDWDAGKSRAMIKTGLIFFAINILAVVGQQQADPFVISHVLGPVNGPPQVTAYSVVQKLSQISFLCLALTQALWPAYAEAIAREDFAWVRRTIRRSLKFSVLSGAGLGLLLCLFGVQLVGFVSRAHFSPSVLRSLLFSFAGYILVNGVVLTVAVIINGANLLKQQLVFLILSAAAAMALKIVLCKVMGASGVVWASNIAFTLFFILPGVLLIRKKYGWS